MIVHKKPSIKLLKYTKKTQIKLIWTLMFDVIVSVYHIKTISIKFNRTILNEKQNKEI